MLTFSFKFKSYIKNLHNKPSQENLLVPGVKTLNKNIRTLSLCLFILIGATLIKYNIYYAGAEYKDILTYNLPIGNYSESYNSNIDLITQSSFFLF